MKNSPFILLRILFLLLGIAFSSIVQAQPEKPVLLDNGTLRLGFDPHCGTLMEFTDLKLTHNHLGSVSANDGFWFLEAETEGRALSFTPSAAEACDIRQDTEGTIHLIWTGFPAFPGLKIESAVTLETAAPMSRWTMKIQKPADLLLKKVCFPRVKNVAVQNDEYLAVPEWTGIVAANPRAMLCTGRGRRAAWSYPGILSMQCAAYYARGGSGLYTAFDDTAAFYKSLGFWGASDGSVNAEAVHFPSGLAQGQTEWALPYGILLGVFQGDWYTAAELYRAWALQQSWTKESRLKKGLSSDWLLGTGAWVWNRGRSEGVLPYAAELQQSLGLPVSVFWHWWHGCPYDIGFPEYLPPREGADAFKTALDRAHAEGLHAMVYMNQRAWGMSTQSWQEQHAERFAVKGEDGKVHPEVYNTFTGKALASMCLYTPFWRDTYAGLAERAFKDLGVDGIYMDQACDSRRCYDPTHGHPLGGGNYWMDGFKQLEQDLRKRCAEPRPITLAGEGCGEAWLPYLDLLLTLQNSKERYSSPDSPWEVIPFFHAVYHPYAVLYGSYSSLTMPPYDELWPSEFAPEKPLELLDRAFSNQFCLEQARAFTWGQQPAIANFTPNQLTERAEEIAYFKRIAQVRYRAMKYLLHGEFLRPPEINAPMAESPFSRLSIYAGQQDRLKSFTKRYPQVLASAWRAPDGDIGVAVANVANEPMEIMLNLNSSEYPLPMSGKIYRIDETGRTPIGSFDRPSIELRLPLPARDVWVIECSRN